LVGGALTRARGHGAVAGGALATLAFAATAYATASYWLELTSGGFELKRYVMVPAPGPPYFAAIAAVATILTLGLTIMWCRPADRDW
jgi:hypothetical protein